MLRYAWSAFRDRWPLFVGAVVTTAFAVALTQASLLALISAATADVPDALPEPRRLAVSNGYVAAISLLSLVVATAVLVSVLVVAGTFSFAVAQRHRDFALLRLIGASRRQVRRLLLREALLLGVIATAVGVPAGVAVAAAQDRLLARLGFVPDGFATRWHGWVIAVSAGVGILVSHVAARIAANRAGRARPLAALRETDVSGRVMSVSRWAIGALGFAGAVAMISVASVVGPDAATALAINTCFVLVIALSAWSPAFIPPLASLVARMCRALPGGAAIAELVRGNLRTEVRRTASMAAPIIVLCGLVIGVAGTFAVIGAATRHEARTVNTSTVMATSGHRIAPALVGVDGIDCLSEAVDVVVHVPAADLSDEPLEDTPIAGLAITPAPYLCTHHVLPAHGDLSDLTGATIAVDGDLAHHMRVAVGDTTTLTVAGHARDVRVVAITDSAFGAQPELLLPASLVGRDAAGAMGAHHAALLMRDGSVADGALRALGRAGIEAVPTGAWVATTNGETDRQNRNIELALVGLAALFTVVAIVNTTVNATAGRRHELATLRLVGVTRGQLVRVTLWEAVAVAVAGVSLGTVAAVGPVLAAQSSASRALGTTVTAWPWQTLALTAAATTAIVVAAAVLTTIAATRTSPRTYD